MKKATQNNRSRIVYLDVIKAAAIILVVFCHYVVLDKDSVLGNVVMCLSWAACPLFFMAAGALQINTPVWDWRKYAKRFAHTYVVLIIWKALYFLFYSILGQVVYTKTELFQYLFLFDSEGINGIPCGHLWFMDAYLLLLLLCPVFWFLFHSGREGKILLLFLTIIAFLSDTFVISAGYLCSALADVFGMQAIQLETLQNIMPFTNAGCMIPYFVCGGFLYCYGGDFKNRITEKLQRKISWNMVCAMTAMIGLVLLIGLKYYQTGSWRWEHIYLENGYHLVSTLILTVSLFLLFQQREYGRIGQGMATYVGTNTLAVYYLHYPILYWTFEKIHPYLIRYDSFAANCIKTILVTGICVLLCMLLKRIPFVKKIIS